MLTDRFSSFATLAPVLSWLTAANTLAPFAYQPEMNQLVSLCVYGECSKASNLSAAQ